VAPIENDTIEINAPSHLPKTNPANKAKGEPKPSKRIQIMLKIENKTVVKNIFFNL